MMEAHILSAVIDSEAGNFKAAEVAHQQAFAQDFSIRENPVFMLMRADVEIKQKDFENALKTLEHAFELPGVKDASEAPPSKGSMPLGIEERCRIFVNLC